MTDPALQARAERVRNELGHTLDAIEDKLNVQKQFERLKTKAKSNYDEQPVPWMVGAGAVAAVVLGLVAWALFTDD
ncbi:uncharacterized protein DUF3618 [Diaminobutyricimonas aerilata]|uniref:Uncharacterized protein DUF3618 n=1 Tax=Diaminobutyricimonas aerilata TaxID=1162967 RepID=A0A2M9CF43_9MICO|nr:DUF3618 domain-containing protein [Diaminobutyricimonas aerilata]PJJ70544.1 uncharacterized protein DUF3618 [Diaminobutyricimonas aerilata]